MKKSYVNAEDRKDWLEVSLMSSCMEKIVGSNISMGKAQTYMKTSKTYAMKALDEFAKNYPSQLLTLSRDVDYYNLMLVPKVRPDEYFAEKIKEIHEDPRTQLYDVLDVIAPRTCKGCCEDGSKCNLCEVFVKYKIPCLDEDDKLCKYRY